MALLESLTPAQVEAFDRDGFVIVERGLVPDAALERLRERFLRLFEGEYETGIKPDEVNWVPGRDPEDRTRQICNGWRADGVVAAQVLSERTGRLAAQLAHYRGVRLLQDNVLWKPPGAKAIGFHQDASYADYLVPAEMITCWISLDDLPAEAGPVQYVRGSQLWPRTPPQRSQFHAPEDWLAPARAASPGDGELDLVPVVVKAGGGSFHHGRTWHGSPPNTSAATARMALVSHMLPVRGPLPRDERRPGLLALPTPRRPLARRVVLPRAVGRVRLPHAVAGGAAFPLGRLPKPAREHVEQSPRRGRLSLERCPQIVLGNGDRPNLPFRDDVGESALARVEDLDLPTSSPALIRAVRPGRSTRTAPSVRR